MMPPSAQPAPSPPGPHLRDIHLPPEPSWWPPAPGWWLLAVLALALLLAGIWWWRRYRRALRQRRQVLRELDLLAQQHQRDGDGLALASALHQLLRRVARQHDVQAARQRGDAWRQTLARVPVDTATLQQLLALDQQIYRPPASFDHAASVTAVRVWLRMALKPASWKPTATEHADA
ncbi:hypothetical protein ASG75_08185 [Rhodanobacter sp. Soil772]|uniref:DUF4381 domain-containing protein n=1 Tax=Rhodanobacter sp. Soil772 TaxID=1736406 RepID=UPI0006FBB38D|nr:DUF4381 domain-containing protein [Rhodanobacter sp. Soil772]KRE85550.1 hypothetical protein ASG75_08185 [Rhodanobacter sp. Soil772]